MIDFLRSMVAVMRDWGVPENVITGILLTIGLSVMFSALYFLIQFAEKMDKKSRDKRKNAILLTYARHHYSKWSGVEDRVNAVMKPVADAFNAVMNERDNGRWGKGTGWTIRPTIIELKVGTQEDHRMYSFPIEWMDRADIIEKIKADVLAGKDTDPNAVDTEQQARMVGA